MAKPSFMGVLGSWLLAFLGLNLLALLVVIGGLSVLGVISSESLGHSVSILRGKHVAISRKDMRRYEKLRASDEEERAALERVVGTGPIHSESLAAQAEHVVQLRQQVTEMEQRLSAQLQANRDLRTELEGQKVEIEEARGILRNEKVIRQKTGLSENLQRLKSALAKMDPGDIATDIEGLAAKGDTGPAYAVRILKMIEPSLLAEVMGEMKSPMRLLLLPLLENQYANVNAEMVIAAWKSPPALTPPQMVPHLKSMPVDQALKILRQLDRNTREDIWELIAPTRPQER